MDWSRLAEQVRAMRKERGWTQLELAEQAGLSHQMISAIERAGRENVGLATVEAIAKALDARFVVDVAPVGDPDVRLVELRGDVAALSAEDFARLSRLARAIRHCDEELKDLTVRAFEREASRATAPVASADE